MKKYVAQSSGQASEAPVAPPRCSSLPPLRRRARSRSCRTSVGVIEKLGERVPKDLAFTDENGKRVTIGDYLADGKPVLIALVYYKCPMLCSLTLNGVVGVAAPAVVEARQGVPRHHRQLRSRGEAGAGGGEAARLPRRVYRLPEEHEQDWPFLTGDKANIDAARRRVGFKFRWDDVNKTWDHTAAIIALAPDGKHHALPLRRAVSAARHRWRCSKPPTAASAPPWTRAPALLSRMTPRPRATACLRCASCAPAAYRPGVLVTS